jgi:hypothetical protein
MIFMIPDEHERRLEDQWTYLHFKTTMNFSMGFFYLEKSSWMNFAGFSNQSYYACFSLKKKKKKKKKPFLTNLSRHYYYY